MSAQRRAEGFLLAITLIWGSTFVISKALLEHNSPLFYTAFRFTLSAALLLPFFFRRLTRIPASTLKKGTVLGLLLYVGFAMQTVGLTYTTASKSAFFTGLLVVLTPIIHYTVQHVFHLPRRTLKIGNILGVLLAAAGLYLLTSPSGSTFNVGDGLTLICAVMFACYIVYLDFASSEPDKLQLTFVQFLLCGALGLISALFFENMKFVPTPATVASLLYLTIFATIIAMWVQNRYQGDTTPTRAAVIFSMEPVIAATFAYFVRDEIIGTIGVIGAAGIVLGVLFSELSDEIPILRRPLIASDTDSAGS